MPIEILLAVYCAVVIAASVLGGWLPEMVRMTHLRTQLMMSFVAGLMLGIALLHLLPHALMSLGSASQTGAACLIGVIAMFLLLRAFHAHQHLPGQPVAVDVALAVPDHHHDHDHDDHGGHHHPHGHAHSHPPKGRSAKGLGWLGMLFGMGLHTLMDGVALAASVSAGAQHNDWLGLVGLGTFLAVTLHKPLDAFAITSVMKKGGWSAGQLNLVNLAFSLACPLGAVLFYFGANQWADSERMLGWGLAISAGFFICISLADLLPEVSFHDHDRVKLTTALLLGVALAVGIENLPGHTHEGHEHGHVQQQSPPGGSPSHQH